MTHGKRLAVHWLISDTYRAKALIKYDIKRLESVLAHQLFKGHEQTLMNQSIALCESLVLKCFIRL